MQHDIVKELLLSEANNVREEYQKEEDPTKRRQISERYKQIDLKLNELREEKRKTKIEPNSNPPTPPEKKQLQDKSTPTYDKNKELLDFSFGVFMFILFIFFIIGVVMICNDSTVDYVLLYFLFGTPTLTIIGFIVPQCIQTEVPKEEMLILQQRQINKEIVCPHCGKKGFVIAKKVEVKKGLDGAKVTGAVLTGGISILATGLSNMNEMTQATCTNCGSEWKF